MVTVYMFFVTVLD